jgi:hypothetical protein
MVLKYVPGYEAFLGFKMLYPSFSVETFYMFLIPGEKKGMGFIVSLYTDLLSSVMSYLQSIPMITRRG